jgi:hypothetical protein
MKVMMSKKMMMMMTMMVLIEVKQVLLLRLHQKVGLTASMKNLVGERLRSFIKVLTMRRGER